MRLNRPTLIDRSSGDYALEELVAELTSAYLCAAAGIDGRLQHAAYIADWATMLRHDPTAIARAAQAASAAADFLVTTALGAQVDEGEGGEEDAA